MPLWVFPHFSPLQLPFQSSGRKGTPRDLKSGCLKCALLNDNILSGIFLQCLFKENSHRYRGYGHMFYYSVFTLHISRMLNWTKFSGDPCSYRVCSSSLHLCCSSSSSSSPHSCSSPSSHPHCCYLSSSSPCSCSSSPISCFQAPF